jgi:predicted transcriptional regulator of viral defense system
MRSDLELPETFTLADVRAAGMSTTQFYRLRDKGVFEAISRGLYHRSDTALSADIDLLEIAAKSSLATLCLTSALERHRLTDEIPPTIDVALPRGTRRPIVTPPVTWHAFSSSTFDVGRGQIDLGEGRHIGLYDAPRSIIDAIRLRHREGGDIAYGALRRWLRQPGNHPAELLRTASRIPNASAPLRSALEVLGV